MVVYESCSVFYRAKILIFVLGFCPQYALFLHFCAVIFVPDLAPLVHPDLVFPTAVFLRSVPLPGFDSSLFLLEISSSVLSVRAHHFCPLLGHAFVFSYVPKARHKVSFSPHSSSSPPQLLRILFSASVFPIRSLHSFFCLPPLDSR
jgi:hypothetical protein